MSESLRPGDVATTRLAARDAQDAFLHDLMVHADNGIPTTVGLLLNGMVVVGSIAPAAAMAEQVDEHIERALTLAQNASGDSTHWEEARESFVGRASRAVEKMDQMRRSLFEKLEAAGGDESQDDLDMTELRRDLAEDWILVQERSHLTLNQVHIVAVGMDRPQIVDALRVRMDQIAAWWVVQMDESGSASFRLFGGAPDG